MYLLKNGVNTRKKSKKVNNKTLSIALLLPSLAKMGPVLVAYDLVKLMMESKKMCLIFLVQPITYPFGVPLISSNMMWFIPMVFVPMLMSGCINRLGRYILGL